MKRTQEDALFRAAERTFHCSGARAAYAADGVDARIALCDEESRHALQVLRLGEGDRVRLFDGAGRFYEGEIVEASKRRPVVVRLRSERCAATEPSLRVILLAGEPKGPAAETLVRKAVEIGVGEIRFFPAARSVPQSRSGAGRREERWERIALAACKQCERATLPPVRGYASLEAALDDLPQDAPRFVLDEATAREETPGEAAQRQGGALGADVVCLAVGPEGGFEHKEIKRFVAAGFRRRSLGPRILRAETAGLVAAAVLLHRAGDLGDLGA